ncbi:hypothetical protein CEXT_281941 [Caerostris extrusa]|uniref:Uncharacterized protein n=1 Tax=Caerostris extrusa TaxID=172846 RepID=A0AAV4QKH8_CAEEX|nr:hypothetical protein CEXT_281941 [Caerostris extrusa]
MANQSEEVTLTIAQPGSFRQLAPSSASNRPVMLSSQRKLLTDIHLQTLVPAALSPADNSHWREGGPRVY